jgi:two-component system OmpR family response regulator
MRVLVVEDDLENAAFINECLAKLGHVVDLCTNYADGLTSALEKKHEVIVIDRMLPDRDGIYLVKAMRKAQVNTPILFLTNLSGINDRVDGLEAGGDDYLVKPFAAMEFLARLLALTRRQTLGDRVSVLCAGDLEMDLIKRTVRRGETRIDLLPREFELLEYLLRNEGRVVTRTMLLENVWDFHFDPQTNIVETHISRLRAKVDRGFSSELIHTVRGSGYSLSVSHQTDPDR